MNAIVKLTTVANRGSQPVAIYGANGRPYGHARFDPTINRSVLEMPYEDYLKVGPDIAANTTGPFNQFFVTFEVKDAAEGQPTAKEKDLQTQLDAVTKERDALKDDAQKTAEAQAEKNRSNLSTANPTAAAPAAPANILDGQVEALRTARDLPKMADDTIEKDADGNMVKVHRELHPVQAGSPVEDLGVDGQTGKTTTRIGVEGTHMEIIEEREKIEPAKDQSSLKANIEANLDSRNIENQDAAEASTAIAEDQGKAATGGEGVAVTPPKGSDDVDPEEKGGEDDLAQYKDNFRKLRSIAAAEGVEGYEGIKAGDDMIAAIQLHRESKAS